MFKLLLPIITILFFSFYFSYLASAATTAAVTATVTAQNVAITVSDGTVTYGSMALSGSKSTIAADLNDKQTATNAGNVTSQLNIKGQDSAAWTLAGTAGSDQYVHSFCTTGCTSPPTGFTPLTTNYQTLAASVASSGTQDFDLRITLPSTSSSYTQQDVSVTVQAVAL